MGLEAAISWRSSTRSRTSAAGSSPSTLAGALVRFDHVYHGHFKCNRNKLSEDPVLWAYVRDLYQTPGFGEVTNFAHIKTHYYGCTVT